MALSSGDSIASIDLAVNRDGAVAGRKDHITLSMLLLSAEELRQKCIAFGIPTHGSKEVIVQRIRVPMTLYLIFFQGMLFFRI